MRIFYSKDSDPMILDSINNLNNIYSTLSAFIDSSEEKIHIDAIIIGSPEPYDEFLPYIEFMKTSGVVSVEFSDDKGLIVTGSKQNISEYIEAFKFDGNEDGNHHHPEMSLISKESLNQSGLWPFIEADNEYIGEHEN